ncbi:RNA polymerase sigma-70 region 4 domain-containing protein (plasmid) [Rhizobium sp. NXC14]|uniref:sigma factor-like helix-turn-helix DNA-binding protein n=1 Tax=Rhizobium sp. NXC14 TaxID=1981173 RepID=UPI000A20A6CF|nr:sigma factor-like helix-turn-helix DNA-binding protein [Rhizobium sp. NXC14]ARO32319.1 RNA polymerase sigma-70 region 4 domain-containing protein [Rhizobium sp. NXC14]
MQYGRNRIQMVDDIGDLSLAQAIGGELLSVRLQRVLDAPDLQAIRFADVVLNLDTFLDSLRTRPNIGRTSIGEMAALVKLLTPRLLAERGVAQEHIAQACETLFGDEQKVENVSADKIPMFDTLEASLDWLLGQCNARDRLVVERRFGLRSNPRETLEEIGSDYGVTRERIRQIEKRALTRMRVRMRLVPLADFVASASPAAWLKLSEGRGWVSDKTVDSVLRDLDGAIQLSLELIGTQPRTWLSSIATRATHGWIGAPASAELAMAAADRFRALAHLPLPRSISEYGADGIPHVEAALRVELGLELYQGYVLRSKPGPRMRRALGLHRLLAAAAEPIPAENLIQLYHQLCPFDPCSARDADIVMQAAPHLFIETYDQVWFGIGLGGELPVPDDREDFFREAPSTHEGISGDDEGATCVAALAAALDRRGPERLLTLYQNAHEILPPGRSPNSVGPTLLLNPQIFLRFLPGVYGLRHQLPSPESLITDPPPYLLDNNQVRLLAFGRRAGERRDVFPLWSSEGEFALAKWGRHNATQENYRSLLAVADIDAWPISGSERAHWQEVARREGRFELADTPRQDAYVRPELHRILAGCIEASNVGTLNWMAVNRMAGRRIDSHAAVSVLAILIALGILNAEDTEYSGWQRTHLATDRARDLVKQMTSEMSSTGILSWNRGIGSMMRDEICAASTSLTGWPEPDRLIAIFDSDEVSAAPDPAEMDSLDMLMAESRQSAERQNREDLLRWLLEE